MIKPYEGGESANELVDTRLSLREIVRRGVRYSAYGTIAIMSVFVASNIEETHAFINYISYDDPSDDDFIPDKTGCERADPESVQSYIDANTTDLDSENHPVVDPTFSPLVGSQSVATSKPTPILNNGKTYAQSEPLISFTLKKYFNQKVSSVSLEYTGLIFDDMRHHGDPDYEINWDLANTYTEDVFENLQIYDHPDVAAIVSCFKDRYESGDTKSQPVEVGVLAADNMCLNGNAIVTLSEDQDTRNDCHSQGFAIADLDLNFLAFTFIDKRYMVVPGAVNNPQNFERMLNMRFAHELGHILFFNDLSNTFAEMDEEERFIDYVTEKMLGYYGGEMPEFIVVDEK